MFKVEFRTTCKVCGEPIKEKRFRTFCSDKCRNKFYQKKYQPQRSKWQRERMDKKASVPSSRKKQCGICGKWYVQVGSHIFNRHGMTAREYREKFDLPVKRGIVPKWYREKKAKQCAENGTIKNLKAGKVNWYKKGDPRAKLGAQDRPWKGGRGRFRQPDNLYG